MFAAGARQADVPHSQADVKPSPGSASGTRTAVDLREGIRRTVAWFRSRDPLPGPRPLMTRTRREPALRWADLALVCPPCCDAPPLAERPDPIRMREQAIRHPIVGGIPRFVSAESYAARASATSGRSHRYTQVNSRSGRTDSRDTFAAKTGLGRKDLEGRLVLDAGVGSGRFAEIAADLGADVVGVDLSRAVEAAAENLLVSVPSSRRPTSSTCRSQTPRSTWCIRSASSITRRTLPPRIRGLARLVKPGGLARRVGLSARATGTEWRTSIAS